MAFEGTLDAFGLTDVLCLLEATAKTGFLAIEGDRGSGAVWIHDGQLVSASADGVPPTAPPEEVIFELLRYERGSFHFVIDDPPQPEGRESREISLLVEQADLLVEEWRELEAVVPSPVLRVALIEEIEGDEVTVGAQHWPALVAVASGGTIADVGTTLGLGELGVARLVRDLVELGVAIVAPPGARVRRPVTARRRTTLDVTASTPSADRTRWVSQQRP